jgi:ADP-heptose:LPS heptosyltransferase
VIDLSGRTTVREAIALLLRAEALIGIDSFLRCAAYYTATPSVILYQPPPGVDPEEHFRGYFVGVEAPQNRVLRVSRLDDITPEQVYDALAEALVYAGRERRRVEILPDSKSTGM